METEYQEFKYLANPFNEWLMNKLSVYYEKLETSFFFGESHKALLTELKLTDKQFYERFLKPYEGLSAEQLVKVATIQTELGHIYLGTHLHFLAKPVLDQYMNALEWTILNISDLNFAGLLIKPDSEPDNFSAAQYLKEPYNQCRYCGRPEKDVEGNRYGERQRKRCTLKEKNISCSAIWQKFSRNTREKISNKKRDESRIYFLDKCQERFEWNVRNACWTIGTSKERPRFIGTFIDRENTYVEEVQKTDA